MCLLDLTLTSWTCFSATPEPTWDSIYHCSQELLLSAHFDQATLWFGPFSGSGNIDFVYSVFDSSVPNVYLILSFKSSPYLPAFIHKMPDYKYLCSPSFPVWWRQWLWRYEWWKPHLLWWVCKVQKSLWFQKSDCTSEKCAGLEVDVEGSCFKVWVEGYKKSHASNIFLWKPMELE